MANLKGNEISQTSMNTLRDGEEEENSRDEKESEKLGATHNFLWVLMLWVALGIKLFFFFGHCNLW